MNPATLDNVAKYNSRLLAICDECAHTVELSVDALIKAHGHDYEVPRIKMQLRCTRCQSDSCAVQVALPWRGNQ